MITRLDFSRNASTSLAQSIRLMPYCVSPGKLCFSYEQAMTIDFQALPESASKKCWRAALGAPTRTIHFMKRIQLGFILYRPIALSHIITLPSPSRHFFKALALPIIRASFATRSKYYPPFLGKLHGPSFVGS